MHVYAKVPAEPTSKRSTIDNPRFPLDSTITRLSLLHEAEVNQSI